MATAATVGREPSKSPPIMRLRVTHRTHYEYPSPVRESSNELRLCPRDTQFQTCDSSLIIVLPSTRLEHYIDLNGNVVHHFEVNEPHSSLTVTSKSTLTTRNPVNFEKLPYGFSHSALPEINNQEICYPFIQDSTYVSISPEIWRAALDVQDFSQDVFQTSYSIMEHIYDQFEYRQDTTSVTTHASEVIAQKSGVCQDFAHAMLAYCRALGIPARYVSGYFFDATWDRHLRGDQASHAWVEIYIPDHGWIGLDPTNNKVVDSTYIKVAVGRDYAEVAPLSGVFVGPASSKLKVTVKVELLGRDASE